MKYKVYIYGRTLKIDFREICSPQEGLSIKTVSLVKELINTDVLSNGDITRPRYLFVRDSGRILFGIGFNHRQYLKSELQTDFSRKRGLRSFVGIVVEESEFNNLISIPTDPDFFIRLYLNNISTVWDLEDRPKNRKIIISDSIEQEPKEDWCKLDGSISFNSDFDRCRFFESSEEEKILSSIKKCPSNIAIGLNVESHVLTSFRRFNVNISNALCIDTQVSHDYEFVKNNQTVTVQRPASQHKKNDLQSSKAKLTAQESTPTHKGITSDSKLAILSSLKEKKEGMSEHGESFTSNNTNLMSINWGEEKIDNLPKTSESASLNLGNEDSLNISSSHNESIQDYDHQMESDNDEISDEKELKKGYSLKLLIMGGIAVLAVLAFMVGRCSKSNQTNPQKSASGDPVQVMKTMHKK